MIYTRAKGHGGEYVYFFCRGRQDHTCNARYIDEESIESAVFNLYGRLRFPKDLADRIRSVMRDVTA